MLRQKYQLFKIPLLGLLMFLCGFNHAFGQSCNNLPLYTVDLTNSSSVTLTNLKRQSGNCCGGTDNAIQFKIILGPNSLGIKFDLSDNSGSYTVNCVPTPLVDQSLCLTGAADGIYYVTYSKPGNDPNDYKISAVPYLSASSNSPTISIPSARICEGSTLTLTASPTLVATYTWTYPDGSIHVGQNQSIPLATVANSGTYSVTVSNTAVCLTSASATATTSVTINGRPAAPGWTGNQAVCADGTIKTLTATASAPGMNIEWFSSSSGGTSVSPVLSSTAPANATFWAEAVDPTTGCRSTSRTAVNLAINPRPNPPTVTQSAITQCEQSPVQTLDARTVLSSASGVTWYDAATGGNIVSNPTWNTVGASKTFYAEYSNGTCPSSSRTPVTLTITPAPLPPVVSQSSITQCQQSPLQTLDARTVLSSATGVTWYSAASGGSVVAAPTLNSVGTVTYYAQYSNGTCSSTSRTPVTLTITPAPLAPTVSQTSITQCEQSPVQTLDARTVLSSQTGVTWYDAATGGNVVTNPTWNTIGVSKTFYAEYSNGTCSSTSRTAVTLTITPAPAPPVVTQSAITQCEQSPLQTLDARTVLSSQTGVTWYDAPTGGNVVANPTWNTVGVSKTFYAQYSNGTCSSTSRTAVTLTITPAPAPPVVTQSAITQCEQSPLQTLDARTVLNSQSGVTWYTAASGGSVVASPMLNATGTVTYFAEYSNGTCSSTTRSPVTLTINPAPLAPTVTQSSITQCEQTPVQTLDARTVLNSQTRITWYDAPTGGNVVASPTWNTVGVAKTFYAEYSNGTCSSTSRTAVILTITPAPAPPTVTQSSITECQQSPLQTLDARTVLSSASGVTWFSSASGGSPVASPTLNSVGTVTYYAQYSNGICSSTTRTAVTLTIIPAPAPPAVTASAITECEKLPVQTLDARTVLSSATGVTWYSAASGGSVVAAPTLNSVGTVTYYAQYSNGTCSSTSRTPVTLTITPAPLPPTVSQTSITQCEQSPVQTLDARTVLSSQTGVTWYDAATGGNVVANPTWNSVGVSKTFYAEYSNGTCSSTSRTAVTLTITPAPAPPVVTQSAITQCEQSPLQTLDARTVLSSQTGITWYDAPTGGNVVANPTWNTVGVSKTFYAQYSNGTCSSTSRTAVTLTITPAPAPPVVTQSAITQCEQSPLQTLDARTVLNSQTGVIWYDAATGGNVVASPTWNTVGTAKTFYAEYSNGTCPSTSRTAVTLTITPAPAAPSVLSSSITECEKLPIQTLDARTVLLSPNGVTWYSAASGGSVVASPTLNATGTVTYFAEYSNGTCSSTTRTPVTLTITPAPAPPAVSSSAVTECEKLPVQTLDARSVLSSQNGVTWYSAASGGSVVPSPTIGAKGTVTYFAEYSNGICSSTTRTPVTLTITPAPAPPAVTASAITECEKLPVQTLDARAVLSSANGVTWYSAASGGSVVTSPTLSATGTVTYFAEYSNGTCSSTTRTPVTLTITPAPAAPAVTASAITECEKLPVQTLDARAVLSSQNGITWYSAASGGSVVTSPTLNSTGTVTYFAEYSNGTCSSTTRTPVTLTITPAPAPPAVTASAITECEKLPIQTLDARTALSSQNGVTWYSAASGGSVVASPTLNVKGTVTYFAEYFNGTCSSTTRTPVTLTINPAPAPPAVTASSITECEKLPIQTLDARTVLSSPNGVTWYSAASGGSVVASPTLNTTGTVTYFAEYSNGTCSSIVRTPVSLTINPAPAPPAVSTNNITQCQTSPLQTLDARAALLSSSNIVWYNSQAGGTPISAPILNTVGSVTYYAESLTPGGCRSLTRTAVSLTIKPSPTVVKPGAQEVCTNSTFAQLNFTASVAGSSFRWINSNPSIGLSASGTGSIPAFLATNTSNGNLTATITVFASYDGCEGPAQTFIITVLKPIVTTNPLYQKQCSGEPTSVAVMSSNQPAASFTWSVSAVDGVSGYLYSGTGNIPSQTLFATRNTPGTITYRIVASNGTCQGPEAFYVYTIVPRPTTAQTYGDPNKRNSKPAIPIRGNIPQLGIGKWTQIAGPNIATITDAGANETTFSGHVPGTYEFAWTISNDICASAAPLKVLAVPPPDARDDNYLGRLNTPYSGNAATNDVIVSGSKGTYTIITTPTASQGSVVFNTDGTFTFSPATGFVGTTEFTYQVCDEDLVCDQAKVTIRFFPPTVVHLTPTMSTVKEGRKTTITAVLENPLPEDYTLTLKYTDVTTTGNDYRLSGNSVTMKIPAGQTTTTDQLTILGFEDGVKEPTEYLIVEIQEPSTSILVDIGRSAQVEIEDVFPTAAAPNGPNENGDIRPDPLTSPNDDGIGNDGFFIYNISAYPDNEVVIFNRWGNEVFRLKNYDNHGNSFRGRANKGLTNTSTELVDGVYYYLIYTKVNGVQKTNKGYIILKRKK